MGRTAATTRRESLEDITVRRAGLADARLVHDLILDLAKSLGAESKVRSSAEDIARAGFGPAPVFEALIAERRGGAVGLCLFFDSFSSWNGRRGVYVQDLYVAEGARGVGLGRRLLAEAAAIVRARGGTYLRLSVDADNAAARDFYERVGLRRASTERIYQVRDREFAELAESARGTKA
jgi:ribosomal protein S18 acetylase RimI-like enzyme